MKKLGRNEPCWCGSGKKYKKCHLDRDKQEPRTIQEALESFKRAYNNRECMAPLMASGRCTNKVINAHTVPRAKCLTTIADSGHVFGFDTSLGGMIRANGKILPSKIGVGRASTFTEFCTVHDGALFEPLEKAAIVPTAEQAFLLDYRVLCRELYAKHGQFAANKELAQADRGRNLLSQIQTQVLVAGIEIGASVGLTDLESAKTSYDQRFLTSNWNDSYFYAIVFSAPPPLLAAGGTNPEYDFFGHKIFDLSNLAATSERFSFSLLADGGKGFAVFSWLGSQPAVQALVESLDSLPEDSVTEVIARLCFSSFENIFWSISWWDGLAECVRSALLALTASAIDATVPTDPTALVPTELAIPSWRVESRLKKCAVR